MKKLHVVRLTPPGRGAVAVLLLDGPGALDVFEKYWTGPKPDPNRPVFGNFRLGNSNRFEQVVVHGTTPDSIEIHSHGGPAVVRAIESTLVHEGAEPEDWIEFYCSKGGHRQIALSLLPFAPTLRTAQILLDQYNGALEREIAEIDRLCRESAISEDELEHRRARFQENARLARHLVEPFRVVLAGGTNAGKSSLLNAILGFQRAIVDPTPGTTRDVVSGRTALDGFPVELFDTAGFRETDHDLERQGIERSSKSLEDADLVVWVVDPTVPEHEQPEIPDVPNLLLCRNKVDLIRSESFDTLQVSALTGEGIEELLYEISRRLVPRPPEPLEAVSLYYLRSQTAARQETAVR